MTYHKIKSRIRKMQKEGINIKAHFSVGNTIVIFEDKNGEGNISDYCNVTQAMFFLDGWDASTAEYDSRHNFGQ